MPHAVPCCRGITELGEYASLALLRGSNGMTVANLADPGNGMRDTWVILAVEWVIFIITALYLEQVGGAAQLAVHCNTYPTPQPPKQLVQLDWGLAL